MSEIEIRPPSGDELRAASDVLSGALLHPPASDEQWDERGPSWLDQDSLAAWDGDRIVGHVAGFRFSTLVPGGAHLATSGVTRVGIAATHRRRGVARRLLERLLVEAAERGQVLASLRASEAVIYQRYGFGIAGVATEVTVDPSRALPIHGAAPGTMRLLGLDEVIPTVHELYPRVATRVGVIDRPDWLTRRYFQAAAKSGGDAEYVAVHTSSDGVDDGFVHYAVKWKEGRGIAPQGTGEVYDLWGADPAVELALWEYVCSIDLIREWFGEERPIDETVQFACNDWRAYMATARWDEQWLRLLDVDAALTARTYNEVVGTVTIAVDDPLVAANTGTWEVSAGGAKRVDDTTAGDLTASISALSAAYLGGTTWYDLVASDQAQAASPEAVRRADLLFASTPAPFCGSGF